MPSLTWSLIALGSAIAALLTALAPVLARWRRRRTVWLTDPALLLEPAAPAGMAQAVVLILSIITAYAGIQAAAHALTPFAFFLAAFACFTVCHTLRIAAAGIGALALNAAALITAAVAWLPAPLDFMNVNVGLACAAAGAHAAWLARFWRQQLLDGAPWTTAGRLIPGAAVVGVLCALAAVVEATRLCLAQRHFSFETIPALRASLTLLLLLAAISLSLRNAADWRRGWRAVVAAR